MSGGGRTAAAACPCAAPAAGASCPTRKRRSPGSGKKSVKVLGISEGRRESKIIAGLTQIVYIVGKKRFYSANICIYVLYIYIYIPLS